MTLEQRGKDGARSCGSGPMPNSETSPQAPRWGTGRRGLEDQMRVRSLRLPIKEAALDSEIDTMSQRGYRYHSKGFRCYSEGSVEVEECRSWLSTVNSFPFIRCSRCEECAVRGRLYLSPGKRSAHLT